jgi:uncharacterized protein with ParB-like and HNH nuclease domain
MTKQVTTKLLSLAKVAQGKYGFSIPSYQRPYVWPEEDVLKLFEDIKDAFEAPDEDHYFIGTVLTAINAEKNIFELIDGQQRTTTLMLIALAFRASKIDCELAKMAVLNGQPRLQFDIRETVQHLLGSLAGLEPYTKPSAEAIKTDPYLTKINSALMVLLQRIDVLKKSDDFNLKKFANFIYNRVQWVNNTVPDGLNVNRMFSSLNTAGVQLEPVDLLKAKIFKLIRTNKSRYDAIWLACEHTENYFERNLRKVFPNTDWNELKYPDLHSFDSDKFAEKGKVNATPGQQTPSGLTIVALAMENKNLPVPANTKAESFEVYDLDVETVYCRSIVSFELLLIHALRIFYAQENLEDIQPRLKVSNLLAIFQPLLNRNEAAIKNFIELLWQVRYQFDTWVVKWIEHDDSNEEQLRLTSQSRSKSDKKYYINRSARELNSLTQLQAVRNFTGERSAQYWLTPFLGKLVKVPNNSESKVLAILEEVDNQLSLSTETQKQASFAQAKDCIPAQKVWQQQVLYFARAEGTSFVHYWFQKLEYLLWNQEANRATDKFKKYRITSKNSVEHVHPQNEEYGHQLDPDSLNAFGNLVLLSPGENSSYSNQAPKKKKADFESKPYYDSLKLKHMFELMGQGEWQKGQIRQHQSEMIDIFSKHYKISER